MGLTPRPDGNARQEPQEPTQGHCTRMAWAQRAAGCAGLAPILAAGLAALPALAALLCEPSIAAEPDDLTVELPRGETALVDIGAYRVFWQSYGKRPEEPVEMPVSWAGHFDARTGISYLPWGKVLGRDALLMHSPWRVPPGITWVEYRLALPEVTPILLAFGTAMGPDVARPDRSDGVTFSASLSAGGRERELMRRHQEKAAWVDESFDLSEHAGRTVTLRLAVEPGPARNSAFDYSFFGDAKVVVGEKGRGDPAALVERLTSTRAYRATSDASLLALSSTEKRSILPSNLLAFENRLGRPAPGPGSGSWTLLYEAADVRIAYTWTPRRGTLDDLEVRVDGGSPFRPAAGGGITCLVSEGDEVAEVRAEGGRAADVRSDGDALHVRWEYPVGSRTLPVDWTFRIAGKAMAIEARCDAPPPGVSVARFSLGSLGPVPLRKTVRVPYLAGQATYLPLEGLFVCRYLDWTVSHASSCPEGEATYDPKTDGTRNPLRESGYVAVSPDIGEVLPGIPHPPSPWLAELGPRVMLDIWSHHRGTYQGDAENLLELKDNGVDHLAIISHVWQCHGYDVKLPDHLPADARYGGDEGMRAFGKAANDCGYVWSLHENYIDLYPDAPSYDPSARVLLADGRPSPAWFNAGTGVQSFGLKCNRALEYAKGNSPEIHRRFGTNAAYLDVHTCVPPWHQLDHEAGQPMAAMALAKVRFDSELFQFEQKTHGGPLFGEGANHFYWAGLVDGVEAQVAGGEDHSAFLDFDLLRVHPRMVNHGMGYYERWFRRGYSHELGHDTGTMEQIDKYRAQEIAYGHAGFVGSSQTDNVQWVVREHHLLHPLGRLWGTSRATEIRYEVAGRLVSASIALAAGDTSRQRVRYESGLAVWVNWRAAPWTVEGRVLPQWGFLGRGPETEVSLTLRDGKFADRADCPEYLFVDARTYFHMPYLRGRKDIEPRLRSFKYLGGNRAEVTYEWVVDDTLEDDYHCFVHGVPPGIQDRIAFQQDHALPKPTSRWRKGETIVDGPHELAVAGEGDTFDLVMGLFKRARVRLVGAEQPGARILVARIRVERKEGAITGLVAEKVTAADLSPDTQAADFKAHLNPEGTWIDFGEVATDGSVKIEKGAAGTGGGASSDADGGAGSGTGSGDADGAARVSGKGGGTRGGSGPRLTIFPYPRERKFRVTLDLAALAPAADPARARVRALAASTREDLGAVDVEVTGSKLTFTAGMKGAGRYVVTWD